MTSRESIIITHNSIYLITQPCTSAVFGDCKDHTGKSRWWLGGGVVDPSVARTAGIVGTLLPVGASRQGQASRCVVQSICRSTFLPPPPSLSSSSSLLTALPVLYDRTTFFKQLTMKSVLVLSALLFARAVFAQDSLSASSTPSPSATDNLVSVTSTDSSSIASSTTSDSLSVTITGSSSSASHVRQFFSLL